MNHHYMGVSVNGLPLVIIHFKLGFSLINHLAIGVPPFMETTILKTCRFFIVHSPWRTMGTMVYRTIDTIDICRYYGWFYGCIPGGIHKPINDRGDPAIHQSQALEIFGHVAVIDEGGVYNSYHRDSLSVSLRLVFFRNLRKSWSWKSLGLLTSPVINSLVNRSVVNGTRWGQTTQLVQFAFGEFYCFW